MLRDLLARLRQLRFLQLTLFFLFILLTLPLRTDHPFVNIAIQLALFNALVVSLSASGSSRLLRWLLYLLWVGGEALYLRVLFFPGAGDHRWDVAATGLCFALMMAVCIAAILPHIFRKGQITLDTIFAAVVAYLLVSFIFANCYSLMFFLQPQSFNLAPTASLDKFYAVFTQMLYFSLVTIVGVGYGDILPLLPFPRMLAAVEGMLGHFYIAVLVAWLVGTFISQSLQIKEETQPAPQEPMET